MKDTFICKKCGTECDVVYDYGDTFCYCETCNDYADGFDVDEFEESLHVQMVNQNYDDILIDKLENEV
jgi:hypothetical protein